jgi:hypothetical protein
MIVAVAVVVGLLPAGGAGVPLAAAVRPAAVRTAAVTSGCGGVSVGSATEVVSNQARQAAGLALWPDTALGVLPDGAGYRFLAAGEPDTTPPYQTRVVTTTGTLDDPIGPAAPVTRLVLGGPAGYDYLSGGPVHRDPGSGVVLQMLHGEHRYGPDNGLFYSELNLGRYDPATGDTTLLGPIVRPSADLQAVEDAKVDADLGDPAFAPVTVGGVDYLYVYFPDFAEDPDDGHIVETSLAVARAPLADVIAAARAGTVSPWQKYYRGGWSEPALDGDSSSVQPGSLAWAPDVVRSSTLDATVMVAGVSPHAFVLSTSADGLTGWSDRVTLFDDPGSFDAYPTVVGLDGDPAEPGTSFYVYYTQWPDTQTPHWENTRLLRRLVTCTAGQPAGTTALTAYTDGIHHRVTTAPVTTPGLYPERTWRLPTTAEPGTHPLYGCNTGGADYMLSVDAACEGTTTLQTEGFAYDGPPAAPSAPLYRCHPAGGGDHFVATTAGCDGAASDGLLGYVLTTPSVPFARFSDGTRHWVTTGPVTPSYAIESSWAASPWYLDATAGPGQVALYGCSYGLPGGGVNHMVSLDRHCEGVTVLRTEGWLYPSAPAGVSTVALYRCFAPGVNDHFVSTDASCRESGGQPDAGLLGYARTGPAA